MSLPPKAEMSDRYRRAIEAYLRCDSNALRRLGVLSVTSSLDGPVLFTFDNTEQTGGDR